MNINETVMRDRDAIIQSLVELVRIPSVETQPAGPDAPFGREVARSLEYVLELGKQLGFSVRNTAGYAGHAEFGTGQEIVAVLVHLDVVPEGGQWTYPAFGGEIHDGKIYGRGTIDNKGPAIAALYALKAVRESGAELGKRIRIIFGCDEESGWQCMKHYLKVEETPSCGFAPDAEFPIIGSEKGILASKITRRFGPPQGGGVWVRKVSSGTRVNVVPDQATAELVLLPDAIQGLQSKVAAFADRYHLSVETGILGTDAVRIVVNGTASHASLPHMGTNALTHLMVLLSELELAPGACREFIMTMAQRIGLDYHGGAMGIGYSDDVSGKLTLNLGVMELDEKGVEALIDIRYPVTYELPAVRDVLERVMSGADIAYEVLDHKGPLYVPADHRLIQTLSRVYHEETGLEPEVLSIGGGTYARAIPNAVAFGPLFPGQPELAHQRDEHLAIEDLITLTRIYARALVELAR